jgi:hypothetical protein
MADGTPFHLIIGSEFALDDGFRLLALVRDAASNARLVDVATRFELAVLAAQQAMYTCTGGIAVHCRMC